MKETTQTQRRWFGGYFESLWAKSDIRAKFEGYPYISRRLQPNNKTLRYRRVVELIDKGELVK